MAKFLMLGKYSVDALNSISTDRTKKVTGIIEKNGGKVESMYAILGKFDLAFVVDLPSVQGAIKTSVDIARATGISFKSYPAVTVSEFDKLVG
ncbi:MAG: GYD domain-containing protein [Candidatus Omnitrophota bacterium]